MAPLESYAAWSTSLFTSIVSSLADYPEMFNKRQLSIRQIMPASSLSHLSFLIFI